MVTVSLSCGEQETGRVAQFLQCPDAHQMLRHVVGVTGAEPLQLGLREVGIEGGLERRQGAEDH